MNFNQLLSLLVLRPEQGYSVRVDHPTGDHEFWTLRRQFRGAATMGDASAPSTRGSATPLPSSKSTVPTSTSTADTDTSARRHSARAPLPRTLAASEAVHRPIRPWAPFQLDPQLTNPDAYRRSAVQRRSTATDRPKPIHVCPEQTN